MNKVLGCVINACLFSGIMMNYKEKDVLLLEMPHVLE